MAARGPPAVVLGAGGYGYEGPNSNSNKSELSAIFDEFKKHGHKYIDTARAYGSGTSEKILADADYAGKGLIIDTKVLSSPGGHKPENLANSVQLSLEALKTNKVHIMYLHAPDRTVPIEDVLEAVNNSYKKGHFERFGLSNYSPEEVEKIMQITKEKGWVQPTAYEGLYNLLSRKGEKELFPVLRKYGISFYAYSILGGSFLTAPDMSKDFNAPTNSRFDPNTWWGQFYRGWFFKDEYFAALEKLREVSQSHNLTVPEIAVRWIRHHSILNAEFGDAIIIGGSKLKNVTTNLELADKGPLPEDVVKATEEVWEVVKDNAAPCSF